MATFTSRTVKKVTREYEIPTNEPWGAANAEIEKALAAAIADYSQTRGEDANARFYDTSLRWFARDDAIVISFDVEEASDGT